MISVDEAFGKFASRLELTKQEQKDASRRQQEIREHMNEEFHIKQDFLSGSYKRWTKTKPFKDVDIVCVFDEEKHDYRDRPPGDVVEDVRKSLARKYGADKVKAQRRSVGVDFGVRADENEETGGKVMGFDVVPAFTLDDHYEIPDTQTGDWIRTNPKTHEEKANAANEAFSGEWKRLVRMVKKWNNHHDKPVRPSFLLEVMALELLRPPYGGDYRRELKSYFASAAERIGENWPDPAGLGPPVSDAMSASGVANARRALRAAETGSTRAIRLAQQGKNGEVLKMWRDLFGPLFPLS